MRLVNAVNASMPREESPEPGTQALVPADPNAAAASTSPRANAEDLKAHMQTQQFLREHTGQEFVPAQAMEEHHKESAVLKYDENASESYDAWVKRRDAGKAATMRD